MKNIKNAIAHGSWMGQNFTTEPSYFFSMFIVAAEVSRDHASCANSPSLGTYHGHSPIWHMTREVGTELSPLHNDPYCVFWSCSWGQGLYPCHHQLQTGRMLFVLDWSLLKVGQKLEPKSDIKQGTLRLCQIFSRRCLSSSFSLLKGWPLLSYRAVQRLGLRASDCPALRLMPWILYTHFFKIPFWVTPSSLKKTILIP